ncbi:MAG: hypothetical protein KGY61_02280 [Desulfobacterales bacterium]|nr:hypothetical protein [Desulfobacterales bacterium]
MMRSILERLQWAREDQSGSVIVVALLLLVVMTLVGVTATDTVVTEDLIIRNVGLHQQNVNLVTAGAMEGFQEILTAPGAELQQINEGGAGGSGILSWSNAMSTWDGSGNLDEDFCNPNTDQQLDSSINWKVPESIQDGDITLINTRGETASDPLRIALIGWDVVGTLKTGGQKIYTGVLLSEYLSDKHGMQRLVVKFKHLF